MSSQLSSAETPQVANPDRDATPARALWYMEPGLCMVRDEVLSAPTAQQARIRMLYSGISRGTESLVFHGRVPVSEHSRMRAPLQVGDFPFPVKYGYCAVGLVEAGPRDWVGRRVFVLHPHQDRFNAPVAMLNALPDTLPPQRAVLSANMETALNGIWDSGLAPGDRVAIVGAGVVGALVAFLAGQMPGVEATLVDVDPARAAIARAFGVGFQSPETAPGDCDVVFHTSGHPSGLATALEAAGEEARVVDLSWYGDRPVSLQLGQAFHSRRLTIRSSQVGRISPERAIRFSLHRRMQTAIRLLADARLDALCSEPVAFETLPQAIGAILDGAAQGLCPVVRYA